MGTILQDLKYGLRMLAKNPSFTLVAVLSLALGIGANTAIFSFVNALILRTLPVENPKALVLFGPGLASGNSGGFPNGDTWLFSFPIYREMQRRNQVFSRVAAFNSFDYELHGRVASGGNLELMDVALVSCTYFDVLGVKPILGRLLTDADDQTLGGHPIAVISYNWWTTRLSRDPSALGKTLTIGDTLYTIIGVAPPGFFGTTVGQSPDMWIPLQMEEKISRGPHKLNDKFYQSLDIIARLKPGVSIVQAGADANRTFKATLQDYAGSAPSEDHRQDIAKAHIELTSAATGNSFLRDQFSKPLWILMAVVGLVLLIACANIANLLLERGTARAREIAVRMALGAGGARLIRQMLTEGLVLAGLGGGLGVLFASWGSHFLLAMVSSGWQPIPLDIAPDSRVLTFTVLVLLASAILFGVLPALRSTRVDLTPSLKEGRGAVSAQARSPLAKALIVSQVALSLVLLVGAGLFLRTLINLTKVDTGFNKQSVLLFNLDPSATGYTDFARLSSLYQQVEQRVEALPGVRAASFSVFTFNQGGWNDAVWAQGYNPPAQAFAWFNAVGTGYFATMGLPILAGRDFAPQDTATSPRVAVINETMARKFFPGGSPVGKRFGVSDRAHSGDIEVVGVVRDAKTQSLDETPKPEAYFPYTQYLPDWGIGLYLSDFELRYSGDLGAVTAAVRRTIREVNPDLPIINTSTLREQVDQSVTNQRLVAELSSFFSLLAVFLASIGIYGLLSYAVSRRTNEIGLRMALGADRPEVLWLVMREALALVAMGLAIGIPVALAGSRLVASMLFGVTPFDPLSILAAVVALLGVAAFAGYMPARKASRVDPMVALRYE